MMRYLGILSSSIYRSLLYNTGCVSGIAALVCPGVIAARASEIQ